MNDAIALLIILLLFGVFIGGCHMGVNVQRSAAIKAGVAYYSVNPTNGETKFEWKEIKK